MERGPPKTDNDWKIVTDKKKNKNIGGGKGKYREVVFANPIPYHDQNIENSMLGGHGKLNINATPFQKKIQNINNQHHSEGSEFYNDFVKLFKTINDLSVPLKWKPTDT